MVLFATRYLSGIIMIYQISWTVLNKIASLPADPVLECSSHVSKSLDVVCIWSDYIWTYLEICSNMCMYIYMYIHSLISVLIPSDFCWLNYRHSC